MTRSEFAELCGEYLVDMGIALENEAVRQALKDRNDEAVRRLMETEF